MAATAQPIIQTQSAPTTQTTLFTATARTYIDKFTATNTSPAPRDVTVNLVPVTGTAGSSNVVSSLVSIAPNATYTFPELVGHVLGIGDFVSVLANAGSVTIRASGRVLTAA